MAKERVQKIIARAGVASRRKSEELIQEGEVTINGKLAKLGDLADSAVDKIKVRGKLLNRAEARAFYVMNKPRGVLCSLGEDAQGRPTLEDYLKRVKVRLFPVNRLDFNEEGLVLLTNDGPLMQELVNHPFFLSIYRVKTSNIPTQDILERLGREGRIETKRIRPAWVKLKNEYEKNARIEFAIHGLIHLDFKEHFRRKGLMVEKVTCTGLGPIRLGGLVPGEVRPLTESGVEALEKAIQEKTAYKPKGVSRVVKGNEKKPKIQLASRTTPRPEPTKKSYPPKK